MRPPSIPVALLAPLLLLTACGDSSDGTAAVASESADTILVVTQQAPTLVDIDLSSEGKTVGDLLAFTAPITAEGGTSGNLIGTLVTIDLADPATGDLLEERLGNLVFDFADGTLVVAGGTEYPASDREMQAGEPQTRAVTGGTGTYIGSRGEVITERNDDGSYTHTFTLLP